MSQIVRKRAIRVAFRAIPRLHPGPATGDRSGVTIRFVMLRCLDITGGGARAQLSANAGSAFLRHQGRRAAGQPHP